ncbi:MAG: hypothetical protein HQL51_02075 [Magnetococcales bacterium]|nr:hypothetical protein [Magnetococcales bacterium]
MSRGTITIRRGSPALTAGWAGALLGALLLSGCATDDGEEAKPGAKATAKGNAAAKGMVGKHVDELVKRHGPPLQTMNATLLGGPPSEAFVYPPETFGNDCMNAFVVVEKTGEIINYFCR